MLKMKRAVEPAFHFMLSRSPSSAQERAPVVAVFLEIASLFQWLGRGLQARALVAALRHAARVLGRHAEAVAERGREAGLVLVADGGSSDATATIAVAAGARVVAAPRGRGAQMNAAARLARGPMLLFLHADSRLPDPHLLAGALRALDTAGREGVPVVRRPQGWRARERSRRKYGLSSKRPVCRCTR